MNIDFRSSNPVEKRLSNLYPASFMFLGKQCASIEGVLQALKFTDCNTQSKIIVQHSFPAKFAGKGVSYSSLHWFGSTFERASMTYAYFLSELYFCRFEQNPNDLELLLSDDCNNMQHSIGTVNPHFTILSQKEFLFHLNEVRQFYLEKRNNYVVF